MTALLDDNSDFISLSPPTAGVSGFSTRGARDASHTAPGPCDVAVTTDWGQFGVVLPVMAGSSGAGASVLCALMVDVLQQAGRCALLVDTADPCLSGLSAAASIVCSDIATAAVGLAVRWSWRGHAVVAQMETSLPPLAPVPPIAPTSWLPPSGLEPLHVTIADLGYSWCSPSRAPLTGPGAWLSPGSGPERPCPILVVRPTRPSLLAAEAALARLDPWIRAGQAVFPAQLVVMASWRRNRWPKGVVGVVGARMAALLADAVFIPHDEELLLGGVSEYPTPPRAQAAVAELLHHWGLLADQSAPAFGAAATRMGGPR